MHRAKGAASVQPNGRSVPRHSLDASPGAARMTCALIIGVVLLVNLFAICCCRMARQADEKDEHSQIGGI